MTSILVLTSDLHLTARPQDEYRWKIFDELEAVGKKFHGLGPSLCILGDITDKKDEHPSRLLIRIKQQLDRMLEVYETVVMIQGNHDYIDPEHSAMRIFHQQPGGRCFYFHTDRLVHLFGGLKIVVYPHQHKPNFDASLMAHKPDFVFMHQCVASAKSATGQELEGFDLSFFDGMEYGHLIAGDIHVPQQVGPLTYCGSPYPINFGDDHIPRILIAEPARALKDRGKYVVKSVPVMSIKKRVIDVSGIKALIAALESSTESDWHKVRFRGSSSDQQGLAAKIAEVFKSRNLRLDQLILSEEAVALPSERPVEQTDSEMFEQYCENTGIEGRRRRVGRELLD